MANRPTEDERAQQYKKSRPVRKTEDEYAAPAKRKSAPVRKTEDEYAAPAKRKEAAKKAALARMMKSRRMSK